MLRQIEVLLVMLCMYSMNVYADDNYFYKNNCPGGGIVNECVDRDGDGVFDNDPCEYHTSSDGGYYVDRWKFAQCNCTSYVAYRLNEPFDTGAGNWDSIYGVPFSNSYLGQGWHDGGQWGDAAINAGVPVDNIPIPGDVVYFSGGSYGHVAYVEHVDYDSDMNWQRIYISEYNVDSPEVYGTREITPSSTGFPNKPSGFIHILAYANPEIYFNYFDLGYDFAGQTKEEWEYIYVLVMREYYDSTQDPRYTSSLVTALNHIGGILPGGFGGSSYPTNSDPQPDEGYVDPVSNHKHAVGMHYVKYKMSGQKNWHYGEVTVDQGTNQKIDIRVKVKEKEGWVQNNVYVDLYYSGNKWFSRSHDTKVSTEKIKKLKKKQKESVYFYNINLSNLPIGHHYYFADIRYGDKHNISSKDDDEEYVVVNVQDPNNLPTGYVDRVTCDTITGWASDEDSLSPLNVHIYDGNAMIANIYADEYRSDVGYRSFTYTIPESYKDGTLHRFRVFAINEPQGKNPLLTQGSFTFACGNTGAMPVTRFYNSHKVAHFYSIRPEDEQGVTRKFRDWETEGTTFNAFPNPQDGTIPLYTCWTGSTHDYDTDPAYVGDQKPCTENVWKLFDVYQDDGPNRTPIYLMYRANKDNYIFAVGQDDVQHLQSTYGFSKVYTDPLFYAPNSLVSEEITTINPPDDTVTPISLDKSTDETEQKNFNQASFLLID